MDYLPYILIGVAVVAAVLELLFFIRPLITVARSKEPEETPETNESGNLPKVTVISNVVSADDDIDDYLDVLMNQTYPDYDVVLVYESVAETAAMIAERYAEKYPSLYVTFIPPGSHNLSKRKLAFTLGMKAAKGDVVITTASNVRIPSALWLETMAAPFSNPEIEVALGYSRIDFDDLRGIWKWYREFDTMMTDARWIGYAFRHDPYRGDSNNLAFRRHIFFEHNGYARTINLQNGEDDLFVKEITDRKNTAMLLGPDCILDTEWGDAANRIWNDNKERYDFTRRWLPKKPFFMSGMSSAMQWIVPGALVAASLLGLPSVIPAAVSAALLLVFWFMEISVYRCCAARMQVTRLWWSVPLFLMMRPVVNFIFRRLHYRTRKKNYTWQRKKNGFRIRH